MSAPRKPWPPHWVERLVVAVIVLGGLILALVSLTFFEVPEANAQLLAQLIGTVSGAVSLIAAAIWRRSGQDKPDGGDEG